MKTNDTLSRDNIRAKMQKALSENDTEGFSQAFEEMSENIQKGVLTEYEQKLGDFRQEMDERILTVRGVRQLTSEERAYYQKLTEAMKAPNPQQAVSNLDVVMPKTIIDSVFDDLRTNHPLLNKINFVNTGNAVEITVNTNAYQEAKWGSLTAAITEEAASGFKVIRTNLLKLSAFLKICKAMLDVGPEWLDRYIREILYEMLANGLERGILAGTGKEEPIGMIRQSGEGVTVTDGVYPKKTAIAISDLRPATVGNLLSLLAMDPNGKTRPVRDIILVVNPVDYYQKVMPATTLMAPDGSYRNDVMPYPMSVISSPALERGEAAFGLAYRYFANAGMSTDGRIEYSDHYKFLEDERVYIIKSYANGMPLDNNAFLRLDISGLKPLNWKVEQVTPPSASTNANLSDLKIGSLTLSPAFAAATTSYTAATTNATNTVTAMPADAGASIAVTVGDKTIDNGTAATWADGANTVTITVTAADGETTKAYTVTVTKS